jgi:predicted transcriptional regulator
MASFKVHIGKKIQEVVDNSSYTIVAFAKEIGLTRDGVYKIFKKESIDTEQLQKISKVLKHDFFNYYQKENSSIVKETKPEYGFATKAELAEIAHAVLKISKAIERIEEQLPVKKTVAKKKSAKKKHG